MNVDKMTDDRSPKAINCQNVTSTLFPPPEEPGRQLCANHPNSLFFPGKTIARQGQYSHLSSPPPISAIELPGRMSSPSGSMGVGSIKQGGTEHDYVVMHQQVGAERLSKSKDQRGASESRDKSTDKDVWPDQQRYDSEASRNNNNSISVGHSAGRDDGTEDTKHPPSAQRKFEKITSTGRKPDSIYFSERDR